MDYLPVGLDLRNKPCLVVGGGEVARRKIQKLRSANANVTVVSPEIHSDIQSMDGMTINQQAFSEEWLSTYERTHGITWALMIAATDDAHVNALVAEIAEQHHVLVNVVDQSAHSDVVFTALVDRDPLTIGVSTQGQSPALLRLLRAQLDGLVPRYYAALAELFKRHRQRVKDALPALSEQRLFWKQFWRGRMIQQLDESCLDLIEAGFKQQLRDAEANRQKGSLYGSVALVGAGPGDPELLTLKAVRLIQWADVILYDRLVSPAILRYANASAELIYVGKQRDDHSVPQTSINQLLVDHAKQGKQVVRLKGGDPFIFGRGGEELDTLNAEGLHFEVVPAVSAANGCAAYAGIPLTHRDHAQSVRFLPGYSKHGECVIDWATCLNEHETLVLYMASQSIEIICDQLIQHGRDKDTPIALVEHGTLLTQRVHVGTLDCFYQQIQDTRISAPSLLVIGHVVTLRSQLNWFDTGETHDNDSV
ncbi:MAG: siroheme synthase CysG [Pseudomonadota bacterium]